MERIIAVLTKYLSYTGGLVFFLFFVKSASVSADEGCARVELVTR